MKKILFPGFFCLSIAIILIFTIDSCKPRISPAEGIQVEYAKEVNFPNLNSLSLSVYTLNESSRITPKDVQGKLQILMDIAGVKGKYKLNDEEKSENELWFKNPEDPSSIVNFTLRNGDMTFNGGMAKYRADNSTPDLVKSDQAEKMAREYIHKLKIPVNENELVVAHIGGVNLGTYRDGKSNIYEKFTTVRFDRKLDGIPVLGHSRIVIQLAEKGRLNSIVSQWAPLNKKDVSRKDILVQDDLKKQIEKAILSENTETFKILVESLQVAYFDDGSGIIEPAVYLKGRTFHKTKDKEGKELVKDYPYDTFIPLLISPKVKYPFNHEGLAKKPSDADTTGKKEEIRRSPDDLNKR